MKIQIQSPLSSTYIYGWKNNPKRQALFGLKCKILAHGKKNSVLIRLSNGNKEIVSRRALRLIKNE